MHPFLPDNLYIQRAPSFFATLFIYKERPHFLRPFYIQRAPSFFALFFSKKEQDDINEAQVR